MHRNAGKDQQVTAHPGVGHKNGRSTTLDLESLHTHVENRLAQLPHQVLLHARNVHDDLSFFTETHAPQHEGLPRHVQEAKKPIPPGVEKLIADISGVETLGERMKEEVLSDQDTRRVRTCLAIGTLDLTC